MPCVCTEIKRQRSSEVPFIWVDWGITNICPTMNGSVTGLPISIEGNYHTRSQVRPVNRVFKNYTNTQKINTTTYLGKFLVRLFSSEG